MEKVKCSCCGREYMTDFTIYSICPYCIWEEDPTVEDETDFSSANDSSLADYRQNMDVEEED
nr:hypothetical protein DGKKSRWO_DGKKSRWO_CDS_0076 [uncultured phage]CAI9752245.1 hypothetical protein CVNMHQAP_CVNMHQAP_CDS_0076 [uncultured phage]